jgi:hypothetical protein
MDLHVFLLVLQILSALLVLCVTVLQFVGVVLGIILAALQILQQTLDQRQRR